MIRIRPFLLFSTSMALSLVAEPGLALDAGTEFFETRIRPILAQECYECHSEATKSKGGLLLDTRGGWETGGDSGPVIVPGKPGESILLQSIAHEREDLKMPKAGAQLDPQVIGDFRKWIEMGAPDPRDEPPSPEQLSRDTNWEAIRERRKGWWSFQPIRDPAVPQIEGAGTPVDRFIRERLGKEGLPPAEAAEPAVLHRRLSFALAGLPPTVEDSRAFLEAWQQDPDKATNDLVTRLLDSPAFAERWARHWMDWMRYAETHGSEGDPAIPHAWQYRDYLIRALHADIPYDQLLTEHVAGDLLAAPRINDSLGLNESAIGPAHYRMVFHGFAPTDALDERVRFTDDQINTVTKAFLGLTVSCARCHDHKFDAISQADYFAMFGIFTSALPATVAIDAPGVLEKNRERLAELKDRIRVAAASYWLDSIGSGSFDGEAPAASLRWLAAATSAPNPLAEWRQTLADYGAGREALREFRAGDDTRKVWDLSDPAEAAQWTQVGEGLGESDRAENGDFVVGLSGVIDRFLPGGVFTHRLSTRHRGFLASPPHRLDGEYDLYLHVAGDKATARFSVQHYPRKGLVYPVTDLEGGDWRWVRYDRIDYWKGDEIHLELSTANEAPVHVKQADRSWFGIREAVLVEKDTVKPPAKHPEWFGAVLARSGGTVPGSGEEIAALWQRTVREILTRWRDGGTLRDEEISLLEDLRGAGAFPDKEADLPESLRGLLKEYRTLEAAIPEPTRAPGITERPGRDAPLFVRGNHKEPGEPVARRFLEAIDETPYTTDGSGRLELAQDFLREDNPFTARVAVNRIWTHLFGSGLVATVDNFGRLGEEPSHPDLLDYLASRFRGEMNWSVKSLVRELVLSGTYRQASEPSPEALARDPDNRLLSYFPVRRLDAEAIRDSLLSLSGELEPQRFGPPQAEGSMRRAVYLRVVRNNLHPLLTTFDFPVPASTVGRRDTTNVPAQSLTLLNDPFIAARAASFAAQVAAVPGVGGDDEAMIDRLFAAALNRGATDQERDSARSFLQTLEDQYREERQQRLSLAEKKSDLEQQRERLLEPVRAKLLAEQSGAGNGGESGSAAAPVDLKPVSAWDFGQGLNDLAGESSLVLKGSARVEDGALVLDGGGYAVSSPLLQPLRAKTLEAVVTLETLDQKGGGVISVQDTRGILFDSIVYSERQPQQWLAGSNNHRRTADFNAPAETEAANRPVRLTFIYEADGTIRGYREGEPLGDPIRVSDLQEYEGGGAEVVLGLRHGTGVGGNRALRGRIHEATLYDRALTPGEVRAAAGRKGPFLSRAMILDALTDSQRKELSSLEAALVATESALGALSGAGGEKDLPARKWSDLAHAIFNLKEFIYLQ